MNNKAILIVDDEKNIRLTLSQSLAPLDLPVRTAVNGEEALQKLQEEEFGLILLDLRMPGMDGMEVLNIVRKKWPKTRVIVITAHGTIESAVEALKLGAVDFIQKPFSPGEIRDLVTRILEREALDEDGTADYHKLIELCKRHVTDREFEDARSFARKAIAVDPGQPEAYNLLGALLEIKRGIVEAQRFYRAAIDIDPSYKPARDNPHSTVSQDTSGRIALGSDQNAPEPREKTDKGVDDEK